MAVKTYGLVKYSFGGVKYTGSGPYKIDIQYYKSDAESDRIIAGNGPNVLWGNDGNDRLYGKDGSDRLAGGDGRDILYGGAGADYFVFDRSLAQAGDRVMDFSRKEHDKVVLAGDVMKKINVEYHINPFGDPEYDPDLGSFYGRLSKSEFRVGTKALLETDRIIYNKAKGELFYDADGSGAGAMKLIAQFKPGTVLTAADFMII